MTALSIAAIVGVSLLSIAVFVFALFTTGMLELSGHSNLSAFSRTGYIMAAVGLIGGFGDPLVGLLMLALAVAMVATAIGGLFLQNNGQENS